ncbi:MAG: hypothetical protein L0211_18450 [Planctomycetaceae bacterium]|nr:hypothetical protein [Planctomycetaceae bacterium]
MNRTLLALAIVLSTAQLALAQRPGNPQPGRGTAERPVLTGNTTPDMWYYTQERERHDNPKQAVRRKAEYVAQQRALRIESMKWFGMSNARPIASTTPFMDEYAPAWVGNGYHPYHWVGVGSSSAIYYAPTVIVR